ncbi:hypothetical protein PpBr36_01930 [Pyricularia pennisetigena]|uniref:hypothetical protein n=1 Tax=Pyricularia pennisetigena TaxID=1578925 RepID=UPI00114DEA94|nr:hypothetical protein PpBr36_01930 [Pyricularia pennisetigena]TLS28645.1 hypothetical protein PpBr36_01930 [Pyricularia pennisetigena]
MHINTFLITAGFIALGSADSSAKTFTSAGTVDKGFIIPENLPEGVYTVTMDGAGKAHHSRVADLGEPIVDPEPLVEARTSFPPPLFQWKKRHFDYDCADHARMDPDATDRAVAGVRNECGTSSGHYYAIANGGGQRIAAFYCRFSGSGSCGADLRYRYESIAGVCGKHTSGWSDWWVGSKSQFAIGYLPVNPGEVFCGTTRDAEARRADL